MGRKFVVLLSLISVVFLQSCSENTTTKSLIAKDPLAVVYMKSMKDFKATLPAQAMMAVSMAEGAAVGLDDTKPIYFVLTTLNPVSAYLVLPLKDISKKDELINTLPENMKPGVKMNGSNALIPLYGNLPSEFAPYDNLSESSLLQITSDLEQIEKKYGSYIREKLKEGLSTLSEVGGEKEQKMFTSLVAIYTDLIDLYLKNSESINIEYSKADLITIDGVWKFKAGSKLATAANSLGKYKLPKISEFKDMAMYYSGVMDWKEIEPLFGDIGDTMGPLYKEMGVDIDLKKFMNMFKKVGLTKMVGGMNMDIANNKMFMNYVISASDGVLFEKTMFEIMEGMAKAPVNEVLKVKEEDYKFKGNKVYSFDYSAREELQGSDISAVAGGDATGFYFTEDEEGLEKVSQYKFSESAEQGYMLMVIDYSKLMPQIEGVPPLNFKLKMLMSGESDAMTLKMSFE